MNRRRRSPPTNARPSKRSRIQNPDADGASHRSTSPRSRTSVPNYHDHGPDQCERHVLHIRPYGNPHEIVITLPRSPQSVATWRRRAVWRLTLGNPEPPTEPTSNGHSRQDADEEDAHMDTAGNTGTIPRDIPPRPDPVENQLASSPSRPYTGPLRGCSWNAQALFARKTRQHKAKSGHAIRLMGQHDFLAIQETHSDVGRARMLRCGPDVTTFWSHNGSNHTAGVALWLRSSFLQQFDPIQPDSWQEHVPGRAASLHLQGPQGALHIYTVYMPSGHQRAERDAIIRALLPTLRPQTEALTLLLGDWNFTADPTDRFCRGTAEWTGAVDSEEASAFALTLKPHHFHELHQDEFTHSSERGESRLDRVYSNHHLMDQLDRDWGCAALAWAKPMSDHRPISMFRRARPSGMDGDKPLDPSVFKLPEWKPRALMEFSSLVSSELTRPSALRKLVLLKQAITSTADRLRPTAATQSATTFQDQLGATMAFIRATERQRTVTMRTMVQRYASLMTYINPDDPSTWTDRNLARLRDHAVDLGRKALMDDLRLYQERRSDMEPAHSRAVKERLHARLRRFAPGGTGSIKAMQLPDAQVTTEPAAIAKALTDHWKKVFRRVDIDPGIMEDWLREALPPAEALPPQAEQDWALAREDVAAALRQSGNTMAGPDRIPYAAWRVLGDTAVDVLFEAGQAMQDPDFPQQVRGAYGLAPGDPHPFNLGTLVCLPKKAVAHHHEHGEVYSAENTRPLSIVDTSNRIIANSFRHKWEPRLARWICPEQRGFLPGRSILANVIDIEEAAAHQALGEDEAAIFLFDFSAAFPSVNQDFLVRALSHIGLPAVALNVVRALYDNNRCRLAFAGTLWGGFELGSGIRQGCPLSPLLFATVLDPFLRLLQRRLVDQTVRAYADDTATVVGNLSDAIPLLVHEFGCLARVANLVINIHKTICIPLWLEAHGTIADRISALSAGAWSGIQVNDTGKYLGFYIGPGKGQKSWVAAGHKMVARSAQWPWNRLGLYYSTCAYNCYISSLPSYVAQLEPYPEDFHTLEAQVLAKAVPGPHAWILPPDLHRLKDHYGQVMNFCHLQIAAKATKLRVLRYENMRHGGLRVKERARNLRQAIGSTDQLVRRATWAEWFDNNPLLVLWGNLVSLDQSGITPRAVEDVISKGKDRPFSPAVRARVRRQFQSATTTLLRSREPYNAEHRMRHKLARWRLPLLSRISATRALARLSLLGRCAPPRIRAAVLSTMWNRWVTARRFQRSNTCCLGCSVDAHDSIEHYSCCPVIRRVADSDLRLVMRPWPQAMGDFLLLTHPECRDHTVSPARITLRMAFLVTAAYHVTNSARNNLPRNDAEAVSMLRQSLWEAVRNHPGTEQELHTIWTTHQQSATRRPRVHR